MPRIGEVKYAKDAGYDAETYRHSLQKCVWCSCPLCGKERWVFQQEVRASSGDPTNMRCFACFQKRGGSTQDGRGYVWIKLQPDDFFHPMAMKNGYVQEHRLVVAKALGRCLQCWELVHHKGEKYPKGSKENRADNRYPENLQLVTEGQHNQITIMQSKIDELLRENQLLKSENKRLRDKEVE